MRTLQDTDCTTFSIVLIGGQAVRRGPEVEAHVRRATEREGRRARRRRARELASNIPKHIDGMSSDDEVTEQQNLAFKQAKGNTIQPFVFPILGWEILFSCHNSHYIFFTRIFRHR